MFFYLFYSSSSLRPSRGPWIFYTDRNTVRTFICVREYNIYVMRAIDVASDNGRKTPAMTYTHAQNIYVCMTRRRTCVHAHCSGLGRLPLNNCDAVEKKREDECVSWCQMVREIYYILAYNRYIENRSATRLSRYGQLTVCVNCCRAFNLIKTKRLM